MSELTPSIAIIGSGPAGCYSAQFLKKALPDADITVFEALPVPYGLLRYGVAADHQGTKNVSAQFERLFSRGGVRFIGNVEIGKDISLEELKAAFDAVVMATGLSADRQLGIPGDDQPSVMGAAQLLRALNGYPKRDERVDQAPRPLGSRLIVIGNGNVAMDVVRLIAKSEIELDGSDINDEAKREYDIRSVNHIDVIGRSPIDAAKFDLAMLREICHLQEAVVSTADQSLSISCPAADLLLSTLAANTEKKGKVAIRFHFNTTPLLISSRNENTVLTVKSSDGGEVKNFLCDSIITAIGFCHAPSDRFEPATDIYYTGWVKRGPNGTVAENRRDAAEVAATIVANLRKSKVGKGKPGFCAIEAVIQHKAVSFEQWKLLDQHEILSAPPGRCRKKMTSVEEMLAVMTMPFSVAQSEMN
ncbi:oxidoreductase [Serratia inhibens]|uniref:Oxidoreductase n=1 Tax=Serratia inhibens TaxID=2338073 RepID=A0AA92X9U6_9GAMM|nr:FAD-dependent oxidoreductase [Serratia inhibens]RJF58837.1 oxidoreductase [Serratia inhibens]